MLGRVTYGDDPLVADPTKDLGKTLTEGEHLVLNIHQHPVVLWKPVALLLAALTVLGIMLSGDRLPFLVVLLVFAAGLNLLWQIYERNHTSFAATDRRVLRVEGVINKSFPMMRLQKITDMRLDQPLLGRLLGYGTLTIESAGQDQAVRELRYTPHPTQAYRRLNAVIFGEDRASTEEPFRRPPAARAAAAVGRGARRLVAGTARAGGRVAARSSSAAPDRRTKSGHAVNSPVVHTSRHRYFGAGDTPSQPDTGERRGRRSSAAGGMPPRPADPSRSAGMPPRPAGVPRPARGPAGASGPHTPQRPHRGDDTDEIPITPRGPSRE